MKTDKIRIAIVDDHRLFRNGLTELLKEHKELEVIFQFENGREMQKGLGRNILPDVVLMDINMPFLDGYESTTWLKTNFPDIKVLALTMVEDEKVIFKMIKAGASGYLLKESSPLELVNAIKVIWEKGFFVNEFVSGKLFRSVSNQNDTPKLTEREQSFMKLCCSEFTYKEIADQLCVSIRTVDNYRESVFLKLNLKSRSGIILYAIQNEIFKF